MAAMKGALLKKLLGLALVLSLVAALALAVGWKAMQDYLAEPLQLPEAGVVYQLRPGTSVSAMLRELEALAVLPKPEWLRVYVRLIQPRLEPRYQIRVGEYHLAPGLSVQGLLALLASGESISYGITLVEGLRLRDWLPRLAADDTLLQRLDQDKPIVPQLGLQQAPWQHEAASVDAIAGSAAENAKANNIDSEEGLFFPDTYRFQRGDSDIDILRRAYLRMQQVLMQEWAMRDKELPYSSPYEALIMASIVEKETGLGSERSEIAGVFVRRLNKGMRLQTDPTVIYGLGNAYQGNLRRSHLRDASNLYNTYRHHGLPPGPIAAPGRAALHAAMHPKAGESLYFVARGDGSHQFSKTLAEHEAAVRRYQLRRKANYRSSPPPSSQQQTDSAAPKEQ